MAEMERRLSLLFADVAGNAKLYERVDSADADRAVKRCINCMESAVEAFHGRLVKMVGDEMLASFEGTENACQAAMLMQQKLADLPPVSGVKLAARIGFHFASGGDMVSGIPAEDMAATARVVGFAKPDQILASRDAVDALPDALRKFARKLPALQGGLELVEILWRSSSGLQSKTEPVASASADLRLHHRGRTYSLDEAAPMLSLGRDGGCDVVVVDRKSSRQHGRIEKRGDEFFYVDRSTNGSYVTVGGKLETMVRHGEIVLREKGVICFGSSANDPMADRATFELL